MIDFKKNITENMTANILWQYVSLVVKGKYEGSDNVLIFNSEYKYYELNKVTEIVLVINGIRTRIDCKYFGKGSNFVNTIANDIFSLMHCEEENILFVLDGKGSKNKLIKNLDKDARKIVRDKNITFVQLNDLDSYINTKFNILPNWTKRAKLVLG